MVLKHPCWCRQWNACAFSNEDGVLPLIQKEQLCVHSNSGSARTVPRIQSASRSASNLHLPAADAPGAACQWRSFSVLDAIADKMRRK